MYCCHSTASVSCLYITGSGYCSGPRLHSGSGVIGCVGNDSRSGGGGGGRENYLIIYCHWSCGK